jgi:hypothetical protein
MNNLYELISIANNVTDMTIAQLTSQPKSVETIVQRVQMIGKALDDNPDWGAPCSCQPQSCCRMVGRGEAVLEL